MSWFLLAALCLSLASGYRRGDQVHLHANATEQVQLLDSRYIDSRSRTFHHNASKADGLQYENSDDSHSFGQNTSQDNGQSSAQSAFDTKVHENMSEFVSMRENVETYGERRRTHEQNGRARLNLLDSVVVRAGLGTFFLVILCVVTLMVFRASRNSYREDGSSESETEPHREAPRAVIHRTSMHVTGNFANFPCPPNCKPGDLVEVPLPRGGSKRVRIPAGVKGGQMFSVKA
mmetsp:Transcript_3070/g.4731  ORF Transcript_3070/g.4731 Transcript_3070/m.4731 type:complete len:233 (+) Transcript_3070:52-750(+)